MSDIPCEFRAEHPANPAHHIDTRKAQFPPDGRHEQPGWVRSEMKRGVWVRTSDWTDAGEWQFLTPTEIQKMEEEQREKDRKRGQEAPLPRKKKKTKRAKSIAETSDHIHYVDNDVHDERVTVNPVPTPDQINSVNTEGMHPDRVKKCARKLGFKGESRPDIIAHAETPYEHIIPEFIRNLQPAVDRPRSTARCVPPYPYPWPDIRLSANKYGSEGEINTETFTLRGREKIFDGFFGISKAQRIERDRAQQAGEASWRFTGKEKIIEVFFNVDLDEVTGSMNGTPMAEALQAAEEFEELPISKSYLAVDKNMVPIVAFYHDAFERAWGKDYGRYIVKTTTENIDKVARFVPPHQTMDYRRHSSYQAWIEEEENRQFSWARGPDARSGIYYFGIKGEMGHGNLKAGLSKDLDGTSTYKGTLIRNLQVWCGNITQTLDACFAGVDRQLRDEYRQRFATLKNVGDRLAAQTFQEELFAYRALLINVLTEPHVDHRDWIKGWAWLSPFGSYTGGLFCIPLLKRKIPFQPGSVLGIRGERVEHFTTKWRGSNRYSWVFTFPDDLRQNGC
jgi:hypothetical protein